MTHSVDAPPTTSGEAMAASMRTDDAPRKVPPPSARSKVAARAAGLGGAGITYLLVALLVLPPLVYLVYGAFRSGPPNSPAHFTLHNFKQVFASSATVDPLLNTIKIAMLVAALSVVIGGVLAYIVARTDVPAPKLWELLISVPFYLSPMVLTLAVIAALGGPGYADPLLSAIGIHHTPDIYSFFGITVVLTIWMSSYAFLFFRGPMRSINAELSEASRSLGGGFWRTTGLIQARMLFPSAVACGVMIFALVAETFSVPALLGTQKYPTIATEIYFATTYYPAKTNLAATYALLLLLVSGLGLAAYAYISRNASRYVSTGGKVRTAERARLGKWRWVMALGLFVYVLIVTVGPVVSLVLASLQPFINPSISSSNLSADNYRTVFDNGGGTALRNSLVLAVIASALILILGFGVAYIRRFTRFRGRAVVEFIASITVAIPGLALGIGMLWAYIKFPSTIYGSIWILLIAYVARFGSQGLRIMDAGLSPISGDLDDAARSLGARTPRRLRTVLLPLVMRSVGSGLVVVFILVINELPVTIFLYSPRSQTLSVRLFNSLAMSGASQAAVYGVILVGLTLILTPILFFAGRNDGTQARVGA